MTNASASRQKSAVVALDWRLLQKADDVEPVKSFREACVKDSLECLGVAGQGPEICTANLATCEASGIAASSKSGGSNLYGLDDNVDGRELTPEQMFEVVDAYEVSDAALSTCYGNWMEMLSVDPGCMNDTKMGSPKFMKCAKDNQLWEKKALVLTEPITN